MHACEVHAHKICAYEMLCGLGVGVCQFVLWPTFWSECVTIRSEIVYARQNLQSKPIIQKYLAKRHRLHYSRLFLCDGLNLSHVIRYCRLDAMDLSAPSIRLHFKNYSCILGSRKVAVNGLGNSSEQLCNSLQRWSSDLSVERGRTLP